MDATNTLRDALDAGGRTEDPTVALFAALALFDSYGADERADETAAAHAHGRRN